MMGGEHRVIKVSCTVVAAEVVLDDRLVHRTAVPQHTAVKN